jgi:hypothetical protein
LSKEIPTAKHESTIASKDSVFRVIKSIIDQVYKGNLVNGCLDTGYRGEQTDIPHAVIVEQDSFFQNTKVGLIDLSSLDDQEAI